MPRGTIWCILEINRDAGVYLFLSDVTPQTLITAQTKVIYVKENKIS